jgi:serine/threonine/tyrosine-interacting protein
MRIVLRPGRRPSVTPILPSLLVGEYPTPQDVDWLHVSHGVTSVLNLQDHSDLASKDLRLRELETAYQRLGMRFHHVPIPDGDTEALRLQLPRLTGLIHECLGEGGRVLVHCNGGFNRAPTVVIAYLHTALHLPLRDAVAFVKARRACVPFVRLLETMYRSV